MTKTLGIILSLLFFFSAQAQTEKVLEVDQMPYFYGCKSFKENSAEKRNASNQKLLEFISSNLTYPDSAKTKEIEGTVFLKFTVNEKGKVTDIKLLYDIGYGCGAEALRIVSIMPEWEPAHTNNQRVAVDLELPIRFEMVDDNQLAGYSIIWGDLSDDRISRKKLKQLTKEPITALNAKGEVIDLLELKVVVIKNNKIIKEKISHGEMDRSQKKLLKRFWAPEYIVELVGTVQKKGKFYYIHREIQVK